MINQKSYIGLILQNAVSVMPKPSMMHQLAIALELERICVKIVLKEKELH